MRIMFSAGKMIFRKMINQKVIFEKINFLIENSMKKRSNLRKVFSNLKHFNRSMRSTTSNMTLPTGGQKSLQWNLNMTLPTWCSTKDDVTRKSKNNRNFKTAIASSSPACIRAVCRACSRDWCPARAPGNWRWSRGNGWCPFEICSYRSRDILEDLCEW